MSTDPQQPSQPAWRNEVLVVALLLLLGLALRLIVWRWHEQYPLGGDEREYLAQALALLQQHRYIELRLMRPPLYTGFLAACIALFDSLIQNLRLAQALLSTLTIIPAYALARTLINHRAAWITGLLFALNYTLAATATELLSETLFLFGLTVTFWLLVLAIKRPQQHWLSFLAGLAIGALALIRSVALPLVPLGILWLAWPALAVRVVPQDHRVPAAQVWLGVLKHTIRPILALTIGAIVIVAPWTIRNYASYNSFILIDTTGAENLWLDNDPSGREAVKPQLYALAEDRGERQRLATRQGIAAITADPTRFVRKAQQEAIRFFALQYFDDMRERRAIWVPPAEVWARLLLGDALWLLILLAGSAGLILAPSLLPGARWVMLLWAGYTLFTAVLFHVELRYRLPLIPVLAPYAAWLLATPIARHQSRMRVSATLMATLLISILTCFNQPYPSEAFTLARKHRALWQAQQALARADSSTAQASATQALQLDPQSVLARVILAQVCLQLHLRPAALVLLAEAEQTLAAHPYPHLLRGAILLSQSEPDAARSELAYEPNSLEDLQSWAWQTFPAILPAPTRIDLGQGLDLGHIQGFYQADPAGFRWSSRTAQIRMAVPNRPAQIQIHLASGRPTAAPPAQITLRAGQMQIQTTLQPGWQTITLPIAASSEPSVLLEISTTTFRPRTYDRAAADGRELGIMVAWAAVTPR